VKGIVGVVVVGASQYQGAPCSTEEEAAQSAAGIANVSMKVVRNKPCCAFFFVFRNLCWRQSALYLPTFCWTELGFIVLKCCV